MVKVRRADYIVMDRWQLRYLNAMEIFHCAYCEYANGLIAYATEIAARTNGTGALSSMLTKCSVHMRGISAF